AAAAQAHVDHFGRVAVGGHAADGTAGGPDDAVGNVGGVAAAASEHPHRLDPGVVGNAGHALAVVGDRCDGAGDMGAMPAGIAAAGVVPRIAGIAVAAIAVTGDGCIGDHVVTGDHVCVEIAVIADAGIQHGNHGPRTGAHIPRLVGADDAGGLEIVDRKSTR